MLYQFKLHYLSSQLKPVKLNIKMECEPLLFVEQELYFDLFTEMLVDQYAHTLVSAEYVESQYEVDPDTLLEPFVPGLGQ